MGSSQLNLHLTTTHQITKKTIIMFINDFINRRFSISTDCDSKALDIEGGVGNNRNVCFWNYHRGANQQWTIRYEGNDSFSIRSYTNQSIVLDVAGSGTANGNRICAYKWSGSKNQLWRIVKTDGCDGFMLEPRHCSGRVLDYDVGNSKACLWSKHGGSNQMMRFKLL